MRIFQVVSNRRAKWRIIGRVESLSLKTLATSSERLRLDVHHRVFHREYGVSLKQYRELIERSGV